MDADDAQRLLEQLRADPEGQRRFRAGYPGRGDALEALATDLDDPDLLEAVRRYRHPDQPPPLPPLGASRHPLTWFGVGIAAAVLVAAGWALAPRPPASYRPTASSLQVFEREQTAQEAEEAQVFDAVEPTSVRALLRDGDLAVFAGIASPLVEVGPYDDGEICLFVVVEDADSRSGAGACVPPQQFDASGVWLRAPNSRGAGWYHWGPVGQSVRGVVG